MKKNVLFLSRVENDFERFVAIVDKIGNHYNATIFFSSPIFRLINRSLIKILKCPFNFTDLSSISFFEKLHHYFIGLARKYQSKQMYTAAMKFKTLAENRSHKYARILLDNLEPLALFTCITNHENVLYLYTQIMKEAQRRKIPIVVVNTGIAVFASEYDGEEKVKENSAFACDYFCASGKDEIQSYYFPNKRLVAVREACLAMGDPKNSRQFLEKVLSANLVQEEVFTKYEKRKSIAIFGNNLPNFGDVVEQDKVLLRIVKWVYELDRELVPLVKFHPNTSHNDIKQEIIDLGVEIIPNSVNSINLLNNVDYFISPPTTVMFEAFILDKKILIVDDLDDRPFDSKALGFQAISSSDLNSVCFDQINQIENREKIGKFIWGEIVQDDCRDNYLHFLNILTAKKCISTELQSLVVQ